MRNVKTSRLQARHYEFIAEVISRLSPNVRKDIVVLAFVQACKVDNPKFKPHLFRKACGLEE